MTPDSRLQDLERQAQQFSSEEQLWLIERLVHHLRSARPAGASSLETGLADMAADAEIQRELRAIEHEFAGAEQDGLEHS